MEAHKVIRWAWSQLIRKVLLHNVKEEQDFFDVTLARDDAQFYSHKVIHWAWSPFFCKILLHNVEEEPGLFDATVPNDDDEQIEAHTVILILLQAPGRKCWKRII